MNDPAKPKSPTARGQAPAELVAITKAYELARELTRRVVQYPRSHRFVLGDRTLNAAYDVLELLIEAKYSREKTALLERNGKVHAGSRFYGAEYRKRAARLVAQAKAAPRRHAGRDRNGFLTRSVRTAFPMHRFNHLFETIVSLPNLLAAARAAGRGSKRFKAAAVAFHFDLEGNRNYSGARPPWAGT